MIFLLTHSGNSYISAILTIAHMYNFVVNARMTNHTIKTLDEIEKTHILEVLKAKNGNVSACAEAIGVNRRTLYRRLDRWGVVLCRVALEVAPRG